MPFTTLVASSLAISAMAHADLLPFDTLDDTTSIAQDLHNLFEIQQCHLDNVDGYIYDVEERSSHGLQAPSEDCSDRTVHVIISHTETAESTASPPEGYQEQLHVTQPAIASGTIVYAWTFIATAAALMIRFLITQQQDTITKTFPSSSALQSWLHALSDRLDRFDYWHAVSEWLYVSEELSTDDWLGFDSFLEWVEIAVENVGRFGMEVCGLRVML